MIKHNDKKRLISNFFSLFTLQAANYILPLITFPYLVRVLGVDNFGLLAFATATITYFSIITDYGFDLTATREISIHRKNKKKTVEIFSAVMSIKIVLMLISSIMLTLLVFSFEKLAKDWEVYILTFGSVIGQVLFPIWFFQGMEKMKYITYLNIIAKTIFTIAIFIFVQEKSDYYLVPLFSSLGFIVVGFWSLWIIYDKFDVKFVFQSIETLKHYLFDGWDIFKTRIFVSLYTATNTFILGLLTNNTVVGYYSIAERIVGALGGLFAPANQTIYPFMSRLYKDKMSKFFHFLRKITLIYLGISFVLFALMYFFGETIIQFVNGKPSIEISHIYFVLIFLIFTIPFGALYAQVMVTQQQNKKLSKIIRDIAILNIILVPVGIYLAGAFGMAIVVVILQYLLIMRYYMNIGGRNAGG